MTPLAVHCPDKAVGIPLLLESEFADFHWQVQVYRWEAGRRPSHIDRLCLVSALRSLKRTWDKLGHRPDERTWRMLSGAVLQSADGPTPSRSGPIDNPTFRMRAAVLDVWCRCRLLVGYGGVRIVERVERVCGNRLHWLQRNLSRLLKTLPAGRLSEIDILLLQTMYGSRTARQDAARIVTENFLDRSTGRVFRDRGSLEGPLYLRPLFILAILTLARRDGVHVVPSAASRMHEITLAEGKSPKGNDLAAIEFLNSWDSDNKTPPDLQVAWGPGPASFQSHDADLVVKDILTRSFPGLEESELVPQGSAFVFSMRHDVDRELRVSEIDVIRKFEADRDISSTWFFKPETYDFTLASDLLEQGCEIGYHCSDARTGDGGFSQRLRDDLGPRVVGMCFHGGFGSFYWQGESTLRQIAALGYGYSEWPADIFMHPRPWPWEQPLLYVTPPGVKVQTRPSFSQTHFDFIIGGGGHVIIEDHPDFFNSALMEAVDRLLERGGTVRTLAQHIEVCRRVDRKIRQLF